jgi:NADP-dependent aldehyde dehydrogenase
MLSVSGKNQIGYSVSGEGNHFFYGVNPRTGDKLPVPFHAATEGEAQRALKLAEVAALKFRNWTPLKRKSILDALAKNLESYGEILIHSCVEESGLPRERATQELARSCYQLRSYSEVVASGLVLDAVIESGDPNRSPSPKPELRRVNMAIGPVVVFGASNFPFAYSAIGGDVASALAAGCPVIVKAHPMHPQTSSLCATVIAETLQYLNCPEGIFSHLLSDSHDLGRQLVLAPEVKAVGFTGSIRGGRALMDLAASRKEPIPVFAEMGSVNPVLVTTKALDTNGPEIAAKLAASVALNAGQFCTSPGLLIVQENEKLEEFIQQLSSFMSQYPEQCMLHIGIFEPYRKQVEQHAEQLDVRVGGIRQNNFITPALHEISGSNFLKGSTFSQEVFGSYMLIVRCATELELMHVLSSLEGQLTGTVFCEPDEQIAWWELLQTKVGRVIVNGVPTGVEVSYAQQHGGPYPSSSNSASSSVGGAAVNRFMRPLAFQNCPDNLLPEALKNANPLGILRFVNGRYTHEPC